MKQRHALAAVIGALALSGAGQAADMQLGLGASVEYDTNINRTPVDEDDDVVFRLSPQVKFLEDEGKFHWDLGYRGYWEKAIETNRIDDFSHFVNASGLAQLNSRTEFTLLDVFSYTTASTNLVDLDSPAAAPVLGSFREPVLRNHARLGLEYRFTPRLAGDLGFESDVFASSLPNRADNQVWGGSGSLVYTLSPRHRLGGGVAATFQNFEASNGGFRPPSTTLFFNPFATWTWAVDETTSFTVTAGPTFIDVNQDAPRPVIQNADIVAFVDLGSAGLRVSRTAGCGTSGGDAVLQLCSFDVVVPVDNTPGSDYLAITGAGNTQTLAFLPGTAPGGLSGTDWTVFAQAALSKRWTPQVGSTLSYRRSDSTASGIQGSATLDIVTFLTDWRITELWSAAVRADFTRRESTSPTQTTLVVVEDTGANGNPLGLSDPGIAQSVFLSSTIVDTSLDTNRWGVMARITRRITRNLEASLRYAFNQQTSKQNTAGQISDFDDHLVTLGIVYTFDRWRLW